MRYHLFLNSIRNMVKTTKVFSRKLAVNFQSSTTVAFMANLVGFYGACLQKGQYTFSKHNLLCFFLYHERKISFSQKVIFLQVFETFVDKCVYNSCGGAPASCDTTPQIYNKSKVRIFEHPSEFFDLRDEKLLYL